MTVCCAALTTPHLCAQVPVPGQPMTTTENRIVTPLPPEMPSLPGDLLEQAAIPVPQGVLVMNDGRTFQGNLREVPGGYRVEYDSTYNMVPFEYVLVTAPDLPQAYIRLRDSVPIHTADSHMKLSEWCRDQGLLTEARLEVAAALKQEPLRSDARQLLKQLEVRTSAQPTHLQTEQTPAMSPDGFIRTEQRSAQGISRTTMQEYIRHTQPIVVNKCGNALCHGEPAHRDFTVLMTRSNFHESLKSERNLTMILGQINPAQPGTSPLINPPANVPEHRNLFAGASGAKQRQTLENWIRAALSDKGIVPAEEPAPVIAPVQLAAAEMPVETNPQQIRQVQPRTPSQPEQLLDRILKEERPDPFDPEVFNRRVHGQSSLELRQAEIRASADPVPQAPLTPLQQQFESIR